jgi:hypothetical protein
LTDASVKRVIRVNKTSGIATIVSAHGFFDEPRGLFVAP